MLSTWQNKSRQEIISAFVVDRYTDPHGTEREEQQDVEEGNLMF